MFEKILIPLDGSDHSVHALQSAVQIAKKFSGRITLIHVYSVAPLVSVSPLSSSTLTETGTLAPEVVSKLFEAARGAGTSILADGEMRVRAEGIQVETLLREGHTIDEILKTVKKGEFDLIVMGARGLSKIKEIFLGSVSHGVTRHASCPVLIVK